MEEVGGGCGMDPLVVPMVRKRGERERGKDRYRVV